MVLLLVLSPSMAQNARRPIFSERGGIVGAGYGVNNFSLPEGRYVPIFFIAHLGIDIPRHRQKLNPGRFTLYFEPQVNPVIIQKTSGNVHEWEFGVSVGVKHMYPLSKNLYVYTLISTGPHFITTRTERQARGFIFSDTMGAGTYFFVNRNIAINSGFRIRHMSNANTLMPNHGINTMNYFLGISRILR
jgi:lipid A 3-O-deacylase